MLFLLNILSNQKDFDQINTTVERLSTPISRDIHKINFSDTESIQEIMSYFYQGGVVFYTITTDLKYVSVFPVFQMY